MGRRFLEGRERWVGVVSRIHDACSSVFAKQCFLSSRDGDVDIGVGFKISDIPRAQRQRQRVVSVGPSDIRSLVACCKFGQKLVERADKARFWMMDRLMTRLCHRERELVVPDMVVGAGAPRTAGRPEPGIPPADEVHSVDDGAYDI
jgi:hypothetical protein